MATSNVIPNFDKFKVLGDEHTAGVRWKRYLAKFDMLTVAMNIQDKAARKKALLLHVAGDEVFDIYMTFTDAQKGDETEAGYKTLQQSLQNYCHGQRISFSCSYFAGSGESNTGHFGLVVADG